MFIFPGIKKISSNIFHTDMHRGMAWVISWRGRQKGQQKQEMKASCGLQLGNLLGPRRNGVSSDIKLLIIGRGTAPLLHGYASVLNDVEHLVNFPTAYPHMV